MPLAVAIRPAGAQHNESTGPTGGRPTRCDWRVPGAQETVGEYARDGMIRHLIGDFEMGCAETPKERKTEEHAQGKGQLGVENSALRAVSHYNKSNAALAYIFTRKCPLPLYSNRCWSATLRRAPNGCGLGLRPGSPICTSSGKPCGSPPHGLQNYWVLAPGNSTTCYRREG